MSPAPERETGAPEIGPAARRLLLDWARQAIQAAVTGVPDPRVDERELPAELRARHAAFVTLTLDERLRGCIGRLDYERPLWANVIGAAAAAALDDPRFPPVSADELPALAIEVSVLGRPVVLPDVRDFDPLRQGIVVERGFRRGLFLPGVGPEAGWDREQTLDAVCRKAGLSADAWRQADVRLQVFQTTAFAEPVPGREAPEPGRAQRTM